MLGIGGTAVATGTVGLLWRASQPQPDNSRPLSRNQPRFQEEPLSAESRNYYKSQLATLEEEIQRSPESFKEIAPKVGNLAVRYFCSELGYPVSEYEGKIRYQWADEYNLTLQQETGCINTNTRDDTIGRIIVTANKLDINLSKILYDKIEKKEVQPEVAINLFGAVIHELHHLTSPLLPDLESSDPEQKIRGLGILRPDTSNNKGDLVCLRIARLQLEETVVEESTDRMLLKLGIDGSGIVYARWVSLYRTNVLDNLFGGDNKPLLQLHQKSKPVEFFALVGEKLDAPINQTQQAGEDYLANLLSH